MDSNVTKRIATRVYCIESEMQLWWLGAMDSTIKSTQPSKITYSVVKGDSVERHEITQMVLVRHVVATPGHHVERRVTLYRHSIHQIIYSVSTQNDNNVIYYYCL